LKERGVRIVIDKSLSNYDHLGMLAGKFSCKLLTRTPTHVSLHILTCRPYVFTNSSRISERQVHSFVSRADGNDDFELQTGMLRTLFCCFCRVYCRLFMCCVLFVIHSYRQPMESMISNWYVEKFVLLFFAVFFVVCLCFVFCLRQKYAYSFNSIVFNTRYLSLNHRRIYLFHTTVMSYGPVLLLQLRHYRV
jgi:hypothetical protein